MTNEEAIKNIVAYMYCAEDIPEEVGKAFDLAIKALKERPQPEITNEDIQSAIKTGYDDGYAMAKAKYERPQGEWIRKEDLIHSIAKQYSEHNEVVPEWLSIGDMRGDKK